MPQIGERRSGATETVEWDGQRWQPMEGGAAPQQEGALSRFLGGALSTSPLNPMNLVRAAAHPVDTLGHLIGDPLNNLFKAGGDVKAAVTGERGDRLSSALQAVEHLGGAVPLIGPAGIQAGEKIGNGDIAGGAGELAGLASGALVPDVASGLANNVPGAMIRGGEAVARGGAKLKGAGGVSVGGIHVPLTTMGLAEAVMRGDPKGLAVAAAPYAMEYGGKGVAATGRALEGLRGLRGPKTEPSPVPRAARPKTPNTDYMAGEPELTGNDIADATGSYDRALPGEFASRADSLGQSTLKTMRDAGYKVPEGGFQSSRDIDNIANGPNPDALAAQAAIRKPPSNPPFLKFAAEPDFVDNLPDVPDFSYEPGYSDIPGSTVGEAGSNPLSSRQTARPVDTRGAASALQELLNTPSFRRLRRQ